MEKPKKSTLKSRRRFKASSTPKCNHCHKSVYPKEKMLINGLNFHSKCVRCSFCHIQLSLSTFFMLNENLYCKRCYENALNQENMKKKATFRQNFINKKKKSTRPECHLSPAKAPPESSNLMQSSDSTPNLSLSHKKQNIQLPTYTSVPNLTPISNSSEIYSEDLTPKSDENITTSSLLHEKQSIQLQTDTSDINMTPDSNSSEIYSEDLTPKSDEKYIHLISFT